MQKNNQKILQNCNMQSIIAPEQLKLKFPLIKINQRSVEYSQNVINNIIHKKDPRLLVICGPCSINDINAAFDYAKKLKCLSTELEDQLYIVMRVYLEKPRTITGWKGLINDPYMDGSGDIESGLQISRRLLLQLIEIGLPLATEILNPIFPQYIGELFSWVSIGARTTESQIHREVASGLQSAVGFKNSTDGNINHAINAIQASMIPHHCISIDQTGQICVLNTEGNINSHIILRGGMHPNYYPENIIYCEQRIMEVGLNPVLIIDCSHGNSKKDYTQQVDVAKSIVDQIKLGNRSIVGFMLESYLYSGNQILDFNNLSSMKYGVSVTDACINWEKTQELLYYVYRELKSILTTRLVGGPKRNDRK
ncbi:phospho-2-dehydro-3-deoxyheptonate aldolase, Tyr-sensitive [Candidatus Blochmanniella vafra str. BVAF]|uniref:Phospho-2-dehydro-3-deoxyheptonate aldolase n=1 Tax=Blochmanniella vafra (strain BVAF) TaxID=859654 RepID=E8Q5T6_BLOVB|nr:3-deoxy-7-phosphoheptulonate synthase [Candidatus Blochmannia vafer]ADV33583.1 phospho-2-dehydro-3-deoxyheptonate aldolase, Tyr-sensitive [Candidatus Blochmannia vafer str. BVAF]